MPTGGTRGGTARAVTLILLRSQAAWARRGRVGAPLQTADEGSASGAASDVAQHHRTGTVARCGVELEPCPYPLRMGLRTWSNRLDRRAQDTYRKPYVAPMYLLLAACFGLYGVLFSDFPVVPLILAAVYLVLGAAALVARRRDR